MISTSQDADREAPASARRWAAMAVLIGGFMLDLLNVTIVNVALPTIQADTGAEPTQAGWIVTAYLLAFAATLITGARLGDLYGRKRVFLAGLAAFALASTWAGLAGGPETLIAARAAQGVTAGLLAPQVVASLYTLFDGRERATVFGLFGVIAGVAQAGGLLLGGVLLAADVGGLGWRSTFLISVPAALILVMLGARLVPESRAPGAQRPRLVPASGLTAGLVAIVFALLEGGNHDWAPWVWLLLATGISALVAVTLAQDRMPEQRAGALLPLGLLRQRTAAVALAVQLVAFGAFSGFLLVFILWLQEGQDYPALQAGLVTIAFSAGGLLMAVFVGRLTVRYGRNVIAVGAIVAAGGALAIAGVADGTTGIDPWLLVPGLFVIGVGMNLVMPALTTVFLSAVPPHYAGSASGIWTTSQQFGGAIGTAALSVVFFTAATSGYDAALNASIITITAAFALTALMSLGLPKVEGATSQQR